MINPNTKHNPNSNMKTNPKPNPDLQKLSINNFSNFKNMKK